MSKDSDPQATVVPIGFARTALSKPPPPASPALTKAADLAPGRIVKQRFELCEEIGHGGMGVVYRARDLRKVEARDPDPFVAIKFLSEELAGFDRGFIALQREAKHAQTLNHPNIVKVFDFDRDGSLVFLTMELLQGESLQHRLRDLPGRPLGLAERVHIARGLLTGLSYAHERGISHSDIKPSNVMLCEGDDPKILDFGIARRKEHDAVFDADDLGALTVDYASPEMLAGARPTPADDVFALGCLLFGLYAGRHPFDHLGADEAIKRGLRLVRPKACSRMQWRAIDRALSFRRADRFDSATTFMRAFEARDRLLIGAFAGAAMALILGLGWLSSDRIQSWIAQSRMSTADRNALAEHLATGEENLDKLYYEDAADKFIAALALDSHNQAARNDIEAVLDQLSKSVSLSEYHERVVALTERTNCLPTDMDCPAWVRSFFAGKIAQAEASPR